MSIFQTFIQKRTNISKYISATEFENFMKNDLVCDWLSIVMPKKIDKHPLQLLFNKGINYEAEVIDKLRKKWKRLLPKLSSLSTSREYTEIEHHTDLTNTIQAMKDGESIIYSPFIASEKEDLRGIPDLLVRNDYLNPYFGIEVPDGESVFGSYYYIPIEIKYSTLHFDKSDKTLLNINRTKIYKNQLCVYSKILSDIQGVFPCCSFIIGKAYLKDGKIGHVYFQTRDNEIVKLFYKGLEWLRDVRKNAYKWDLTDPKIIVTLLPNMKTSHPVYDREKKTIAEHFGEITELWQCSVKHRYNVLDQTNDQIFSWKDPLFNASMLNIAPSYLERVEHIIKINKGEMNSIYPKKIKHNLFEWKTPCHEIFVDFETVGDIDENEESTIYLIGIYSDTYTHFLADSIHPLSEKEVILSFYQYWVESGKPKLWCWYAEETMWNRACKKHNLQLPLVWVDLYKVFFEGNVYVKGCKNFKLKSYVNSLLQLKKIKIDLPSETCCNGLDALCLGLEYYETKEREILDDILTYNEFDCQSLNVLLNFIRKEM